jgi:hypothetical protein
MINTIVLHRITVGTVSKCLVTTTLAQISTVAENRMLHGAFYFDTFNYNV